MKRQMTPRGVLESAKWEGECIEANWETSAPVSVKLNGERKATSQKVKTKKVEIISLPFTVEDARQYLRRGSEIRFTDGAGDEWLRLFPMVDTKTDRLYPVAQTMGDFRRSAYDGITPFYSWRKGAVGVEAIRDANKAARELREEPIVSVTPDKIITCPNCGTRFRVGKAKGDKQE